ncbi:MAG: deoxynucleoside kinase [Alphaproteobacteria bacterium]|nr:deoxynucleoside kinase [Alphaproteobacteria bacterium]
MAETFVAIAGNIGVGKTSLVEFLASEYGFQPVYEPFQANPYLDDFYEDMRGWAFHSQAWFLAHKFRLHQELQDTPGTLVQDRTIYEDAEIFATYLHRSKRMADRDFATYIELYRAMQRSLRPPDLVVYLRCSVRAIRRRIQRRGRPSEQAIPAAYLRTLNELYEDWIGGWSQSPVLVWDSERMDYLEDLVDHLAFRRALEPFLAR